MPPFSFCSSIRICIPLRLALPRLAIGPDRSCSEPTTISVLLTPYTRQRKAEQLLASSRGKQWFGCRDPLCCAHGVKSMLDDAFRHSALTRQRQHAALARTPPTMRAGVFIDTVVGPAADMLSRNLPYGDQRRLEIARALATHPKLLLLDEPAAGMNPKEAGGLMEFICQIQEEFNLTVFLIEHVMQVVMGICPRIRVIDFGVSIAEGCPDEIKANKKVIEAYLGEEELSAGNT